MKTQKRKLIFATVFSAILTVGVLSSFKFISKNGSGTACTADAGPDKHVCCSGGTVTLGGSPTGSGGSCGTPPAYCYSWSPTTGLSSSTVSNPTCTVTGTRTYTVTLNPPPPNCTPGTCCDEPTDQVTVSIFGSCCRLANPEQQNEVDEGDIKVFPNPSSGNLTVEIPDVKVNTSITVYDVSGQNVITKDNILDKTTIIDLSPLAKGIYFVRVIDADHVL